MKRTNKKLRLNRDTIRALSQPDLQNVEGAVPPPTYTCISRCLTQCFTAAGPTCVIC